MSSSPTGIVSFSRFSIFRASRMPSGAPRRRIPMKAKRLRSSVFSRISCASRTKVRSISEALINWAFSRVKAMVAKRSSVTHSMLEPVADSLGEPFDFFRLLECADGKDVAIVFLQSQFEFVGELGELACLLQRFLKVGLANLVTLQFTVRKPYVLRFLGWARMQRRRLRRHRHREDKGGHIASHRLIPNV